MYASHWISDNYACITISESTVKKRSNNDFAVFKSMFGYLTHYLSYTQTLKKNVFSAV